MLFYFRMLEHENFLVITGVSSIVAAKSRAQTHLISSTASCRPPELFVKLKVDIKHPHATLEKRIKF